MFEDLSNLNLKIVDIDVENKYIKHYEGMTWRVQKYNPNEIDTDIDFGGTHPHKIWYDIGLRTNVTYDYENKHLESVCIKGKIQ